MIVNKSEIFYSTEVTVTFYCKFRFDHYPLDDQKCYFHVTSYAYDDTKMTFQSRLISYIESDKMTILDYSVKGITNLPKNEQIYPWHDVGNYSVAGFEIKLKRNKSKYLMDFYLPSGIFVVVSWVSTWWPVGVLNLHYNIA